MINSTYIYNIKPSLMKPDLFCKQINHNLTLFSRNEDKFREKKSMFQQTLNTNFVS